MLPATPLALAEVLADLPRNFPRLPHARRTESVDNAATGRRLIPRDVAGGITLTLPSGRQHRIGFQNPGIHCDLALRNYKPVFSAMRRGAVGFAESFMLGDVESSDITAVLRGEPMEPR